MSAQRPRVTFGIKVFNGEPFVLYNLRALYPFAHQIIVVEGVVAAAGGMARPDGRSTDGTVQTLHRFKAQEDIDGKLEIVTKDGPWSEEDEQYQAFARRAEGDYLWIVDIDEFYRADDMRRVLKSVRDDPGIMAVFFKQLTFWGGFDYTADGWYLRQRQGEGPGIVLRLVKWEPGFRYAAPRPVEIHDQYGIDVTLQRTLNGRTLADQGVFMYHYSLVFPRQVREKAEHYSRADWATTPRMREWAEESFTRLQRPYRVHNVYRYPSWLEHYKGSHPEQIELLKSDLASGRVKEPMRPTEDVEALLKSRRYAAGRTILRGLDPFARFLIRQRRRLRRLKH